MTTCWSILDHNCGWQLDRTSRLCAGVGMAFSRQDVTALTLCHAALQHETIKSFCVITMFNWLCFASSQCWRHPTVGGVVGAREWSVTVEGAAWNILLSWKENDTGHRALVLTTTMSWRGALMMRQNRPHLTPKLRFAHVKIRNFDVTYTVHTTNAAANFCFYSNRLSSDTA